MKRIVVYLMLGLMFINNIFLQKLAISAMSFSPSAENVVLDITEDIREYNEGGLTITKEVGSTGNINDIYSKGDYDRILDIHNNVLNPEHGITNSDVKERVINQLGYEVKSLVSFWTDDTGEEYRQLSFIENGQLMITDSGQPAQHIFQGYERSEEISFII